MVGVGQGEGTEHLIGEPPLPRLSEDAVERLLPAAFYDPLLHLALSEDAGGCESLNESTPSNTLGLCRPRNV